MKKSLNDSMCKKQVLDNQTACTAGRKLGDKRAKENQKTMSKEYMKEYRKKEMEKLLKESICKKQIVDNQTACTAGTKMADKSAEDNKRTKDKGYMKEYRKTNEKLHCLYSRNRDG